MIELLQALLQTRDISAVLLLNLRSHYRRTIPKHAAPYARFLPHSHQGTHTRLTDYSRELQYRLNPVSWVLGNVGMDHKTERHDNKIYHEEISCL